MLEVLALLGGGDGECRVGLLGWGAISAKAKSGFTNEMQVRQRA